MKKIVCIATAAVMILGFTACKKDGAFNPKRKISEIYKSSEYMDMKGGTDIESSFKKTEKLLDQVWTWDKNQLKSIEYKKQQYANKNGAVVITTIPAKFAYFEYNGDQLSQITFVSAEDQNKETQIWKYTYNKSKLDKIEAWSDNEITETIKFEHKGNKISKMTWTFVNATGGSFSYKKSTSFSIIEHIMPKIISKQLCTQISKQIASKTDSEKQYVFELSWNGNNVKKMEYYPSNNSSKPVSITFKYDRKKNPFYNDLSVLNNDISMPFAPEILQSLSENNMTEANIALFIEGMRMDFPVEASLDFEYVYDGNFPIEQSYTPTHLEWFLNLNLVLDLEFFSTQETTYYKYK